MPAKLANVCEIGLHKREDTKSGRDPASLPNGSASKRISAKRKGCYHPYARIVRLSRY